MPPKHIHRIAQEKLGGGIASMPQFGKPQRAYKGRGLRSSQLFRWERPERKGGQEEGQ